MSPDYEASRPRLRDAIMKAKFAFKLLTCGLLAFAAWYVHRGSNPLNPSFDPVAEGGERGKPKVDDIPEKYDETLQKGLAYLAKQQHKDGHWEGDDGKHPVAMTGLVGLAMLMEANVRNDREDSGRKRKYTAEMRKASDWLLNQDAHKRDGLIFSGHASETNRYMEGHGLATLLLAGVLQGDSEVLRLKKDEERFQKQTEVLTSAVKYIMKARSNQGGWYHTSKVEGHDFDDVGPTVLQFQALMAAENAGIPVSNDVFSDARTYLKARIDKQSKTADAHQQRLDIAAALVCRNNSTRRGGADQWWLDRFRRCQIEIPMGNVVKFGRDELTHYYYAQVAHRHDEASWNSYGNAMFDQLKAAQRKDGSWPPGNGLGVGSVYTTAIWCIILQLPGDRHPALQIKLQEIG
jgi:hypothetical protein